METILDFNVRFLIWSFLVYKRRFKQRKYPMTGELGVPLRDKKTKQYQLCGLPSH